MIKTKIMEDTRTDEQKRIDDENMERAFSAIAQYEKEQHEENMKLLKENNIPIEDYEDLLDYCSINGKLEIVEKPTGTNQQEGHGMFKSVFVDQWNVGMEGDSFEGYIYGKIGKNKWLKIPYEC